MNWANAELKVDNMKEEIKSLKKTVKVLELDLVKTKQNLGEVMNAVYDYEKKNSVLIEMLKKHNIPLDGLSAKGSMAKDKTRGSGGEQEDTEFVKKFKKTTK